MNEHEQARERVGERGTGREGMQKRKKRGNKKGIGCCEGKIKNKKDIIISKYIAYTFQNVFENTSAKFLNYLFIPLLVPKRFCSTLLPD